MKKGRSTYNFELTCDPSVVDNLIQGYLHGNGYKLVDENEDKFYRSGDAVLEGCKYFNYSIVGQTLTIYAWFKGPFGEIPIEQNSLNVMAMSYRNLLGKLFREIEKLNNGGNIMNNNVNQNNSQMNFDPQTGKPIQQNNQFAQNFQNETIRKQEKMCEWGFWLSLIGLLASFMGVVYGAWIYILNFYFASQGMKTRKKTKAVLTIVLSVISIIVIIVKLLSY